jgi:hypothetical protein
MIFEALLFNAMSVGFDSPSQPIQRVCLLIGSKLGLIELLIAQLLEGDYRLIGLKLFNRLFAYASMPHIPIYFRVPAITMHFD